MTTLYINLGILISIAYLNSVRSDDDNPTTNTTTTTVTTTTINETLTTLPPLKVYNYDVHCKFQPDGYQCDDFHNRITRWYYDIKLEDCKRFKYYRCNTGNKNIFKTYAECRQFCRDPGPHEIEHNLPPNAACFMQPCFGECRDYIPMFYFDVATKRCLGFPFSGCGGNQNRFANEKTCAKICLEAVESIELQSKNTSILSYD